MNYRFDPGPPYLIVMAGLVPAIHVFHGRAAGDAFRTSADE
jgi:hypothetical protein